MAAKSWSSETKHIRAHGAYVNLVEDTFARHEDAIVALARLHKVKRAFFTGRSLGGGLANVAHLAVRGQLSKAGSPWAELKGKVTWLAYTFAAPQTIVRKYAPENTPRLMADLDDSSYNVVNGCDAVPRYPGMLKYLGAIVEIVAPDIVEDTLLIGPTLFGHARRRLAGIAPPLRLRRSNQASIMSKATQFLTLLSIASSISLFNKFVFNKCFAIWLGLAFLVVVAVEFLKKELGKPAEAAVEFLKEKGLAEVMGQFTHTGTVLYKETENQAYIPLKGKAAIQKKLDDVKGAAFTKLLRSQNKATSLLDAHMYFGHFEFGK